MHQPSALHRHRLKCGSDKAAKESFHGMANDSTRRLSCHTWQLPSAIGCPAASSRPVIAYYCSARQEACDASRSSTGHGPSMLSGAVAGSPARAASSEGSAGCPGRRGGAPGWQVVDERLPVLVLVIRPHEILLVLRIHPAVRVIVPCAQLASSSAAMPYLKPGYTAFKKSLHLDDDLVSARHNAHTMQQQQ